MVLDKEKLEKELDVIGQQISLAWIKIYAISEIVEQCRLNPYVNERFPNYLFESYTVFWHQLIHNVSRLQDKTKGCLSLIKIFERNRKIKDSNSGEEKKFLKSINDSDINKKMKAQRDKLGIAHLDGKIAIDLEKRKKLEEESLFTLEDVEKYINLLTKALEIISIRLDQPFNLFKPNPTIKGEIREMFDKLYER